MTMSIMYSYGEYFICLNKVLYKSIFITQLKICTLCADFIDFFMNNCIYKLSRDYQHCYSI